MGWWVAALLALLHGVSWGVLRAEARDHALTRAALTSSRGALTELRTAHGRLAYEHRVLTLDREELAALVPELHEEIAELRVNASRAASVARTGFAARTEERVILRDSLVVVHDTVHHEVRDTVRLQAFDFSDGYLSVSGLSDGTTQRLTAAYSDTLVQVVYRAERPRPWLWFFSPRRLRQRVMLKNPSATIHFSEIIDIE